MSVSLSKSSTNWTFISFPAIRYVENENNFYSHKWNIRLHQQKTEKYQSSDEKITISTKFPSCAALDGALLTSTQWHNISKVQRSSRRSPSEVHAGDSGNSRWKFHINSRRLWSKRKAKRSTRVLFKFNVAFEFKRVQGFHFVRVSFHCDAQCFMWTW